MHDLSPGCVSRKPTRASTLLLRTTRDTIRLDNMFTPMRLNPVQIKNPFERPILSDSFSWWVTGSRWVVGYHMRKHHLMIYPCRRPDGTIEFKKRVYVGCSRRAWLVAAPLGVRECLHLTFDPLNKCRYRALPEMLDMRSGTLDLVQPHAVSSV